jgi:hypothetical protein
MERAAMSESAISEKIPETPDIRERIFGEVTEYYHLIDVLKLVIDERQIGVQSFDAAQVCGLTQGHLAKLMSPRTSKRHFTPVTLGPVLGLLGVRLVVVEDREAWQRVAHRLERRSEGHVRHARAQDQSEGAA